jgi:hypothetical protein
MLSDDFIPYRIWHTREEIKYSLLNAFYLALLYGDTSTG